MHCDIIKFTFSSLNFSFLCYIKSTNSRWWNWVPETCNRFHIHFFLLRMLFILLSWLYCQTLNYFMTWTFLLINLTFKEKTPILTILLNKVEVPNIVFPQHCMPTDSFNIFSFFFCYFCYILTDIKRFAKETKKCPRTKAINWNARLPHHKMKYEIFLIIAVT